MSTEQSHGAGESHTAAWTTGITAAVLLYVLSPPPFAWLLDKYGIEVPDWFQVVYAPLIFAYKNFEPVHSFYDAYGALLGVDM